MQKLLNRAEQFEHQSDLRKARKVLERAIRQANGQCPLCHRALALIYEKMGRDEEAIHEWEILMTQAPDLATNEQAPSRIKSLKEKIAGQR